MHPKFELFCIARGRKNKLKEPRNEPFPEERAVQISPRAFQRLREYLPIPDAFSIAFTNNWRVHGSNFWPLQHVSEKSWWFWCMIPVRIVVGCSKEESHERSFAGQNQMDPVHYIHLSEPAVDIRGWDIGLFVQHTPAVQTKILCVSLLDVPGSEKIDRVIDYIKSSIVARGNQTVGSEVFFVLSAFFSTAANWWDDVLENVNHQLVEYEKKLQKKSTDPADQDTSPQTKNISKELHIAAAHLHRYNSMLQRFEDIVSELRSRQVWFDPSGTNMQAEFGLDRLKSKIRGLRSFAVELESRVANILQLMFHSFQADNDENMHSLLNAARKDQKNIQRIAENSMDLKMDSLSMKTVAILTMGFLPGTSYAAILAMPFFLKTLYSPAQV